MTIQTKTYRKYSSSSDDTRDDNSSMDMALGRRFLYFIS